MARDRPILPARVPEKPSRLGGGHSRAMLVKGSLERGCQTCSDLPVVATSAAPQGKCNMELTGLCSGATQNLHRMMVEGRNIEVRLKNAPREPGGGGGPRGPPGMGMGGPPPPRGEEGAKLYVAHLPIAMGDDQLAGLFQAYGRVLEAKVRG